MSEIGREKGRGGRVKCYLRKRNEKRREKFRGNAHVSSEIGVRERQRGMEREKEEGKRGKTEKEINDRVFVRIFRVKEKQYYSR